MTPQDSQALEVFLTQLTQARAGEKDPQASTANMMEFNNEGGRDWYEGGVRAIRGSAWDNAAGLATSQSKTEIDFYTSYLILRTYRALGGRCARDLQR